jgi:DNA-binding beta-propeller fold protein YncE
MMLAVCSCIKDKPQEPTKTLISLNSENAVYVINEGNYGSPNANISIYDPTSGAVIEDYYSQQNNNAQLGDVCQSMTKYNNKYYIVANNSHNVIVTNASDLTKTAIITGFNSPRYVLPITYNKAYVSDLYANSIQIINLNSNSIIGSIPCNGWTEKMALVYNKAFVTNYYKNYCYVINTITDIITDSINVGKGGASIEVDNNSKIWILTSGDNANNQPGRLVRIDPVTLQIELNLNFSLSDSPQNLCINKTRDTLFFLNKGICKFPVSSNQLSSPYFKQGSIYYGMGINPKDYTIYVSDVLGFSQKSTVEIYDMNGNFKTSFKAGIGSNGFVFE